MTNKPILFIDADIYRTGTMQGALEFPNASTTQNTKLIEFIKSAKEQHQIIFIADDIEQAERDLSALNQFIPDLISEKTITSWEAVDSEIGTPYYDVICILNDLSPEKKRISESHYMTYYEGKILYQDNPYQKIVDDLAEWDAIESEIINASPEEINEMMNQMGLKPMTPKDSEQMLRKATSRSFLPQILTAIYNSPEVSGLIELMPDNNAFDIFTDTRTDVKASIEGYAETVLGIKEAHSGYRSKLHYMLEFKSLLRSDFNDFSNRHKVNIIENPSLANTTQLIPTKSSKIVYPAVRKINSILRDYSQNHVEPMLPKY